MKEMTSRERILAVLNGEMPDKVPVSPKIWAWIQERYGDETYLEYLELKKIFDYDPVIVLHPSLPNFVYNQLNNYSILADIEVSLDCKREEGKLYVRRTIDTPAGELNDYSVYPPPSIEYGIRPDPEKLEPLVKNREDLERLKYVLCSPEKSLDANYERIDRVIGDEGFTMVRPHKGVDHLLMFALGYTNSLTMYYDDRDFFREVLDVLHDYYKQCLLHALDHGAKMIYESWYNCSISAGWSPEIYRECFLPRIREDAEITHKHGAYFHFFDDGKIMPVIDDIKTINMDVLSTLCPPPMGDVEPEIVKRELGPHTVLNGHVDLLTVKMGTPQEVEEEVKRAVKILGKDGGFILGTSDSIRDGSPYENVEAFFTAGRKYGKY
jgi:uroporphyrinogen decarboxylase